MSAEDVKWHHLHEMWAGLGVFLVIVLVLIISYLNGGRTHDLQTQKIKACSHAADVAACIHQVTK